MNFLVTIGWGMHLDPLDPPLYITVVLATIKADDLEKDYTLKAIKAKIKVTNIKIHSISLA